MRNGMIRVLNFLMLSVVPLASGCNGGGGGGGSASVGGLFSASSDGSTFGPGGNVGGGLGSGGELASIHHPEPTTMLLVGGGIMALAYFRNRSS